MINPVALQDLSFLLTNSSFKTVPVAAQKQLHL